MSNSVRSSGAQSEMGRSEGRSCPFFSVAHGAAMRDEKGWQSWMACMGILKPTTSNQQLTTANARKGRIGRTVRSVRP